MCPRGGVGVWVSYLSCGSVSLDLGSRGGHGLSEVVLRLVEGGAGVANRDGHEFHFSPSSLVAAEVSTEEHLVDDEVAVLPVKCLRVWIRRVRDSSGVDEVGSCTVSRLEEGVLGL